MSKTRRIKKQQKQASFQHLNMLVNLLGGFYTFLEKTPKPSNDEVRAEFIKSDNTWKTYCIKNQLNPCASLLFNQEVAQSWKRRYAMQDLQNQTHK